MRKLQLTLLVVLLFTALAATRAIAQPFWEQTYKGATGVQFTVGSQGIGGEVKYNFAENAALRFGASFLPLSANNLFTFSGLKSTNNLSARFSNVHLIADYTPFDKAQWFRLVGGLGYLYSARGAINVVPSGDYKVANYVITAEELGRLNIDVSWKGVAPYVGVGLIRNFSLNSRFTANMDLGTYYLASPRSTIVGTNLLADNYQLQTQMDNNLKSYRWLPVLQLNFSYRITQ